MNVIMYAIDAMCTQCFVLCSLNFLRTKKFHAFYIEQIVANTKALRLKLMRKVVLYGNGAFHQN